MRRQAVAETLRWVRGGWLLEKSKAVTEDNFGDVMEAHGELLVIDCVKKGHPESGAQTGCLEVAVDRVRKTGLWPYIEKRQLDVGANPHLAAHLGAHTAPTTVFISHNEVVLTIPCTSDKVADAAAYTLLTSHDVSFESRTLQKVAGPVGRLHTGFAHIAERDFPPALWNFKKTIESLLEDAAEGTDGTLTLDEIYLTKALSGVLLCSHHEGAVDEEVLELFHKAAPKGVRYLGDARRMLAASHIRWLDHPARDAFLTGSYPSAISQLQGSDTDALFLTLMQIYLTPTDPLFVQEADTTPPTSLPFDTSAIESILDI